MVAVSVSVMNGGSQSLVNTHANTRTKSQSKTQTGNTHSGMPCRLIPGTNTAAYYSNVTGQRIVNAETGIPSDYRVGSLDENLFFKVADATHRNNTGDADIYFYDSPDHYLRHRFSRVRYNVRSKSGSKKRDQLDKERKDDMLENRENEMIHWSLVDSKGSPTDDVTRAYMQPRINSHFAARWAARRAERVAQLSLGEISIVE